MWLTMSILGTEKIKDPVKIYATESDGRITKDSGWVISTM